MKLPSANAAAVLGILGLGLVGALYVLRKGGLVPAATAAGAAAVQAAGSVASGAIGAVGEAVAGLPTPSQTTTDPAVVRYLIDTAGYGFASRWSGAPALIQGALMPAGSGRAPLPGSDLYATLVSQATAGSTGDFARLDRSLYDSGGTLSSNGYADIDAVYDPATGIRLY